MLMAARVLGIAAGVLATVAGVAALMTATADTAVIGAWITLAAASTAIAGGVVATSRPGSAAILFGLSTGATWLVAPGVIPAIADNLTFFLPYLTAGGLLVAATAIAFAGRKRSHTRASRLNPELRER
jgi:hypothetical protein